MRYEDLYIDFKSLFPEDAQFFIDSEKQSGTSDEDGIHVVFGMNVVPFIQKIVIDNPVKATRAFEFFEEMEKSDDSKIAEVLEFTVLEALLTDEKNMVDIYIKFFGEETKEAAKAVGRWFL